MLRHPFVGCNGSGDAGAGFPKGGLQAGLVRGVSAQLTGKGFTSVLELVETVYTYIANPTWRIGG